ncbi:MAG: FAD-dependent oxidoreductase [Acidobacteriota bacterium]
MKRREFLKGLSVLGGGSLFSLPHLRAVGPGWAQGARGAIQCDVAIIGGGVGGCAAALAAARSGMRVVLSEETDWIGGQLTQQAVPPDEHPWIEQFGATRSYREYRQGVRDYYRRWYPLTAEAGRRWNLNPGNCSVSRICHEPRVALAVLESMLAPYVSGGQLSILLEHRPVSAGTTDDRVETVRVRDLREGREIDLAARYFIDATETGELLPLAKTEYVTGAESQAETGEPHAPSEAQPANMQAITWCFAIDYVEGENHTIEKPRQYDFWRDYVPDLRPPWPGKLLSLTYSHPITLEPQPRQFDPRTGNENPDMWRYRRLADPLNFENGAYPGGISLINWPQNDYLLGNVFEVSEEEAKKHLDGAMQLSYSLLYWLQTAAPRPDGGTGWPGLRLRGDLTGTSHGLAKYPYIREARRIRAEFTVLEQHVGTEARMEITGLDRDRGQGQSFPDSVGVGSYRIDLHPSTGGDNYIDISSLPFEIPLGALIPQRVENLLPAAKNLGVTHITNGCYRLHPVEWNIGEAAGFLAAFSLSKKQSPRRIRNNESLLQEFQGFLTDQGIEIRWPKITPR